VENSLKIGVFIISILSSIHYQFLTLTKKKKKELSGKERQEVIIKKGIR